MADTDIIYVCTIQESCQKTFSKYIEWADHEKNDHGHILHVFYCNGVGGCKQGWYDEKEFKKHLEETHASHSLNVDDYLLDPFFKRFWCGFCKRVIQTPEYSWYSEFFRACHIEGHLQGGNAQLASDWAYFQTK